MTNCVLSTVFAALFVSCRPTSGTVAGSHHAEQRAAPALQGAHLGEAVVPFLHCNIVFCRHTRGTVAGS
jgi:hypothetical protein